MIKAVIFPGQGSQYPGMGKDLYDNFTVAKAIFEQIDDILKTKLSEKCFFGTEQDLKETAVQQLAILSVSLAAWEVFRTKVDQVKFFSGLSLGEYSCLYAAGVLSLKDTVLLVKERALAMNQAALDNPSTMFALIGGQQEALKDLAGKLDFYVANLNAKGQTVISLSCQQRDKIKLELEQEKYKVVELAVSGGFHSPFMASAAKRLSEMIEKLNFNDSHAPIVSNFTALAHQDKATIKKNLVAQLTSTVLWNDCCEFMANQNVNQFYELGPGKVLKGLMRKINSNVTVTNLEKTEDFSNLREAL